MAMTTPVPDPLAPDGDPDAIPPAVEPPGYPKDTVTLAVTQWQCFLLRGGLRAKRQIAYSRVQEAKANRWPTMQATWEAHLQAIDDLAALLVWSAVETAHKAHAAELEAQK